MISLEDARTLLRPHQDDLYLCVSEAWDHWRKKIRPLVPVHYARGRANTLYDLMADQARTRFGNRPGVQVIERPARMFLLVGGRLIVRFKKLSRRLRTANYPTQQSMRFDGQLEVPHLPPAGRINVGYRLNQLQTDYLDILAVFSVNNSAVWHYELEQPSADNVVHIPAAGERSVTRLVRPKQKPKEEKGESGDGS